MTDASVRRLAQRIVELERKADQGAIPQLANSSIEDGGVNEYDIDGTLGSRVGQQWDGTHAAVSLSGPVPPTMSAPTLTALPGILLVGWDGTFAAGIDTVAPMDWSRGEVHVGTSPDLDGVLASTLSGTIESPRGGEVAVSGLPAGVDLYARLTARSASGGFALPSVVVGPILVAPAPSAAEVQAAVDAAAAAARAAEDAELTGLTAQGAAVAAQTAADDAATSALAALTAAQAAAQTGDVAAVLAAAEAAQDAADAAATNAAAAGSAAAAADAKAAQAAADAARGIADAATAAQAASAAQGTANSAVASAAAAKARADLAVINAATAAQAAEDAEQTGLTAQGAAVTAQTAADTAGTRAQDALTAAQAAAQTGDVALVQAAADDAQTAADAAQTAANTAGSAAATADAKAAHAAADAAKAIADAAAAKSRADLGVTNAAAAKTRADLGVTNAAAAKAAADAAEQTGLTAKGAATTAQTAADAANTRAQDALTAAQAAATDGDVAAVQAAATAAQAAADQAKANATSAGSAAAAADAKAAQAAADAAKAILDAARAQLEADKARSRGTDLVTNGTGLLGNNTNFSTLTFVSSDAPEGAGGSFAADPGGQVRKSDDLMPINVAARYILRGQARQTAGQAAVPCRAYTGLAPYDSAGFSISPLSYMVQSGTTTTLAQPLLKGDTKITLSSAANWNNSSGTSIHLRSVILWNYIDKFGKKWGAETYSRNFLLDAYADGGIVNNVITLRAPWAGVEAAAGTSISNGSSGDSFMYGGLFNTAVPTSWTPFVSEEFGGEHTDKTVSAQAAFPPGTAFARLLFLVNRPETTATGASRHAFAALSFSDTTAARAKADSAQARADAAVANAATAQTRADTAVANAAAAKTAADAAEQTGLTAKGAAATAQTAADAANTRAQDALTQAQASSTDAGAAQTAADAAQLAANDAQTAATSAGSAAATADAKAAQAAADAAQAIADAAAARDRADVAKTAADNAQGTANGAQTTATAAQASATTAKATADGKNTITSSAAAPTTATPGVRVNDLWHRRVDPSGVITGTWRWSGTAWVAAKFGDAVLDSLTVGKLTAGTLAADVLLGGRIATASSGARREMNSVGFQAWDAAGALTISLDGVDNLLTGKLRTAITGRRIEVGSAGQVGQVDFWSPGAGRTFIRSATDEGGRESIQIGHGDPTTRGLDERININTDGFMTTRFKNSHFVVGESFNLYGTTSGLFMGYNARTGFLRWDAIDSEIKFVRERQIFGTGTSFDQSDLGFNWRVKPDAASFVDVGLSRFGILGGYFGDKYFGGSWQMAESTQSSTTTPRVMLINQSGWGGYMRYNGKSVASGSMEFKNRDDSTFIFVKGSSFVASSDASFKEEIVDDEVDQLSAICESKVRRYRRVQDENGLLGDEEIGLVAQEAPTQIVIGEEGDLGVDVYQMSAMTWRAVQQIAARLEAVEGGKVDKLVPTATATLGRTRR